jgi:hypothetical protein
MNKFDKLTEAYLKVVNEGKTQLRKYRVGLDRPGSGWETVISAKSEKEAVAKANSAYEFGNNKPNEKANYVHDITDEPDETEQKESTSETPISDATPHNVGELGMLCRRLERFATKCIDSLEGGIQSEFRAELEKLVETPFKGY